MINLKVKVENPYPVTTGFNDPEHYLDKPLHDAFNEAISACQQAVDEEMKKIASLTPEKVREEVAKLLYLFDEPYDNENGWAIATKGFKEIYLQRADRILILIEQAGYLPVEPVRLEVLTSTQINGAVADYRSTLEMNGHRPTVTDGRIAISHATITHNEKKGQL